MDVSDWAAGLATIFTGSGVVLFTRMRWRRRMPPGFRSKAAGPPEEPAKTKAQACMDLIGRQSGAFDVESMSATLSATATTRAFFELFTVESEECLLWILGTDFYTALPVRLLIQARHRSKCLTIVTHELVIGGDWLDANRLRQDNYSAEILRVPPGFRPRLDGLWTSFDDGSHLVLSVYPELSNHPESRSVLSRDSSAALQCKEICRVVAELRNAQSSSPLLATPAAGVRG